MKNIHDVLCLEITETQKCGFQTILQVWVVHDLKDEEMETEVSPFEFEVIFMIGSF